MSDSVLESGQVCSVKVLGVLCLLDQGETDWKVIGICTDDPLASQLNDIDDVETLMPGFLSVNWFRDYKKPDNKPANKFGLNGEFRGYRGVEMQYNLGQYLRSRYSFFERYFKKDIEILSSDSDRAISSAMATLEGLFPTPKTDIMDFKTPWSPIPVRTIPSSLDYMTLAILPKSGQLVQMSVSGRIHQQELSSIMDAATSGCQQIYMQMQGLLRDHLSALSLSMYHRLL
ncbi:inorganic pyrophosphatase-like [Octopus sinensis]|uniref:inorganic diphosphatase n=1 Tax=Octopus sinensis TaxID=2607531 RepID=A0A6P7U136_9MOLL|nr:inorganic pyrophosphatase-like [Octopus sinensis]